MVYHFRAYLINSVVLKQDVKNEKRVSQENQLFKKFLNGVSL